MHTPATKSQLFHNIIHNNIIIHITILLCVLHVVPITHAQLSLLNPFTSYLQDNCINYMYNSECPSNGPYFLPLNPDKCNTIMDASNPYTLPNNVADFSAYKTLSRSSCFPTTSEIGNGVVVDISASILSLLSVKTRFTFIPDDGYGAYAPRVFFRPYGLPIGVIQGMLKLSSLSIVDNLLFPDLLNANFSFFIVFDPTPVGNTGVNNVCNSAAQNVTAYKILGGNITGITAFQGIFSILPSGLTSGGSGSNSGYIFIGYNQTGVNELYGLYSALKIKLDFGATNLLNFLAVNTLESVLNNSASTNFVLRMNLACPCNCFQTPVGTAPGTFSAAIAGPNSDRPAGITKLFWDQSLSSMAKLIATNCKFEPSRDERELSVKFSTGSADVSLLQEAVRGDILLSRSQNFRYFLGSNSAASLTQKPIDSADLIWRGEQTNYNCTDNTCAPGKVCTHYTQTVSSRTKYTGCYVATCTSNNPFGRLFKTWYHYVCVYDAASGTSKSRLYDSNLCPA